MTRHSRTRHDLRCFCRGEPKLGVFGVDEQGNLYVHVKIFKQSKIFGEMVASGGPIRLRCRNCLRWHKVVFRGSSNVALEEDDSPPVAG